MELSRNLVMGPTGRPHFENMCVINTLQGLRNLLMLHMHGLILLFCDIVAYLSCVIGCKNCILWRKL